MRRRYRTGDQALVREINLSTVLRYLQESAPLSRARLADMTGLNKTTVSSLVEELVERGLVHKVGLDTSGGGRPATLLNPAPQAGHIIGLELGVGFISAVLTDFVGQIVWRRHQETDTSASQEEIVGYALRLVQEAKTASQSHGARLLGMGLVLPGMVDVQNGVLLFSPNLQWRDVALGQIFSAQAGVRVFVENDATASALGEHLFGVARQAQNFVFLVAGVGLGGGLFLNGDLYRGAGGIAGEIGHTSVTMMDRSRPCRCGKRGCWETSGNQYSLIERVRVSLEVGQNSLIPQLMAEQSAPLTLPIITQAADAGDAVALDALTRTGAVIGVGVSNLINTFNPEMVVFGGTMSTAGSHLLPSIQQAVKEHALAEMRPVEILLSAFGSDAGVMGAVALVVKAILSNPSSVDRCRR